MLPGNRFSCRGAAAALLCAVAIVLVASCGGSGGAQANPVPAISSLNPNSIPFGSNAFPLTVMGSGFISSSVVQWNGSARATAFMSSTQLVAQISANDVAGQGSASVTVVNPSPGGGTSGASMFSITPPNPAPVITAINPGAAMPGGPAFMMTVTGSGFVPSSMVLLDGSFRPTSFVSSSELTAQINALDIATAGYASVTVVTPSPGGGLSDFFTLTISSALKSITLLNQAANDLVWDPVNQVIYLSVPSTAATHANTISVLNPTTGIIQSSQSTGNDPDVLAISGDSSFLYAGIDGANSVQRFVLPTLTTDISYPLGSDPIAGPYYALDLQVAPGAPHTTAVTRGAFRSTPAALGGLIIYDDATARPVSLTGFPNNLYLFDSLQWGSDATALYAANYESTGADFYLLTVNSSGVVLDKDYPNSFPPLFPLPSRIHYDPGTGLLYGDDGVILNPADGVQVGMFQGFALMVPDSTLNTAIFLEPGGGPFESEGQTIATFNLNQLTPITTLIIPNILGNPQRLIRWGTDGLAFTTAAGQIFLIEGSIVTTTPAHSRRAGSPAVDVQSSPGTSKGSSLPSEKK